MLKETEPRSQFGIPPVVIDTKTHGSSGRNLTKPGPPESPKQVFDSLSVSNAQRRNPLSRAMVSMVVNPLRRDKSVDSLVPVVPKPATISSCPEKGSNEPSMANGPV